jgi:hypothetical protein
LSPPTLRIFAARPESLKRLGSRLDFFELLGTLSYPIEARKLLVALKVARGKLPAGPKAPKVRHVVLETEWDTGERLALLEHELPPDEPRPAAVAKPTQVDAKEPPTSAAATKQSGAKAPRTRTATTPTAAQREAFQRALARRNAARGAASGAISGAAGASRAAVAPKASDTGDTSAQISALPSQSLGDLARMATTGRPLAAHQRGMQPKRKVFVVGSGIAAVLVLLVGVVSFQLLRTHTPDDQGRHRRAARTQFFTPNSTLVADSSTGAPRVFSAPTPQLADADALAGMPHETPQPQTFDPDTAPPDPPPPPALEHPGPMEPPSMAHNGPPLGMQDGPDSE